MRSRLERRCDAGRLHSKCCRCWEWASAGWIGCFGGFRAREESDVGASSEKVEMLVPYLSVRRYLSTTSKKSRLRGKECLIGPTRLDLYLPAPAGKVCTKRRCLKQPSSYIRDGRPPGSASGRFLSNGGSRWGVVASLLPPAQSLASALPFHRSRLTLHPRTPSLLPASTGRLLLVDHPRHHA